MPIPRMPFQKFCSKCKRPLCDKFMARLVQATPGEKLPQSALRVSFTDDSNSQNLVIQVPSANKFKYLSCFEKYINDNEAAAHREAETIKTCSSSSDSSDVQIELPPC